MNTSPHFVISDVGTGSAHLRGAHISYLVVFHIHAMSNHMMFFA